MFSGIVEGTGTILQIRVKKNGARVVIRSPFPLSSSKIGDSIAVNGCCLTVVKINPPTPPFSKGGKGGFFEADLSHETLRVTNLGRLKKGDLVNLERPLRLSDRIGGHLVQGHVDGLGRILSIRKKGGSVEVEIGFPQKLRRYIIPKGSIAVDGIGMTVNRLGPKRFTLVVIPHTLKKTNLRSRWTGDGVNLEVDMLGKYVESLRKG